MSGKAATKNICKAELLGRLVILKDSKLKHFNIHNINIGKMLKQWMIRMKYRTKVKSVQLGHILILPLFVVQKAVTKKWHRFLPEVHCIAVLYFEGKSSRIWSLSYNLIFRVQKSSLRKEKEDNRTHLSLSDNFAMLSSVQF